MINKFSYNNKNGISFQVNIGGKFIFFEKDYEDKFSIFFDGSDKGISWLNKGTIIQLWSNNGDVTGLPSIDMQYVIAIYKGEGVEYQTPRNGIIYNADGSLHKVLKVPLLISESAKQRGWYKKQPDETIGFTGVDWKKDKNGQMVVVMEISELPFQILKEYRVLDPETGEFGECIASRIEYK